VSDQGALIPTKQAEASRAIVGGTTIAENYAFVGVHHIFDQVRVHRLSQRTAVEYIKIL
jgi:hypothetical protein